MAKIYAIGESVFDITMKSGEVLGGRPGGGMLNVMVSCARAGLDSYLVSEYGNDILGEQINKFLKANNVNTDFVYRYDSGKTPIAIASIDDDAKARYNFYKNYPEDRLQSDIPEFNEEDYLVFGSIYSLSPELTSKINTIINKARHSGTMIIYDPNYRNSSMADNEIVKQVKKFFMKSDIVKGSDDDFRNIFGTEDSHVTYRIYREYGNVLIYTMGEGGVHVEASNTFSKFPATKLIPVSTIGAGDAFTAGLIYALVKNGVRRKELRKFDYKSWKEIIPVAIEFASDVCMSEENYISKQFAAKLNRG